MNEILKGVGERSPEWEFSFALYLLSVSVLSLLILSAMRRKVDKLDYRKRYLWGEGESRQPSFAL